MKTTYTAKFSFGTVTRSSSHAYKTAAVAVKNGETYGNPAFSAGVARAVMPGDSERRAARAPCYNARQKAAMLVTAARQDDGWVAEVVEVTA